MNIRKIGKNWFIENTDNGFIKKGSTPSYPQWTSSIAEAKDFSQRKDAEQFTKDAKEAIII